MTLENQILHFEDFTAKMKEIILKKGNDYANEDRLSNFKLAGNICGINPNLNCLSLIATKVARLGVLLNTDKTPNNESTQKRTIRAIPFKACPISGSHTSKKDLGF